MRWPRKRAPEPAEHPRYLVVGLGNPGSEYASTRHNVGFRVIDRLAQRCGLSVRRSRLRRDAHVGCGRVAGVLVCLVKPQTFMNLSGTAVAPLLRAYNLGPEAVILIADDIDLPPGRLRIRARGSAGGHRGIQSVIDALRTQEIVRVRIGVGRPPPEEAVDYVLSPIPLAERPTIEAAIDRAADAVETILQEGMEAAMNRFNSSPAPAEPGE
ncbi:MAG: aminoacyl-tRNA hydrolase [Armatimonadetes bacterium]|nr:aminoacyl-tRNA hydrolase [Armatimonadota bacterium]